MQKFYKIIWLFLICSVIGYAAEGLYWRVAHGFFESRPGLIYGPLSQVYGLSAIVMLLVLERFSSFGLWKIFLASYTTATLFELTAGILQVKIFGFASWYYGPEKFGVFERASLLYSVYWGILGILLIKTIYPIISRFIDRMPARPLRIVTWLVTLFLVFDISISAAAVLRAHQRLNDVAATNRVQVLLDKLYPDPIIEKAYPQLIRKYKKGS